MGAWLCTDGSKLARNHILNSLRSRYLGPLLMRCGIGRAKKIFLARLVLLGAKAFFLSCDGLSEMDGSGPTFAKPRHSSNLLWGLQSRVFWTDDTVRHSTTEASNANSLGTSPETSGQPAVV